MWKFYIITLHLIKSTSKPSNLNSLETDERLLDEKTNFNTKFDLYTYKVVV